MADYGCTQLYGVQTLRTQDISALVPKRSLDTLAPPKKSETLRHRAVRRRTGGRRQRWAVL